MNKTGTKLLGPIVHTLLTANAQVVDRLINSPRDLEQIAAWWRYGTARRSATQFGATVNQYEDLSTLGVLCIAARDLGHRQIKWSRTVQLLRMAAKG